MDKKTTVLGKVCLTPRGEYNAQTEYEVLDVISWQGSSWLVTDDFSGITPGTGNPNTILLAQKGEKGDTLTFDDLTDEQKAQLKGDTGEGFKVMGYYESLLELEAMVDNPKPGDAYGIGESAPYDIYIYDPITETWINNGTIQGARGIDGKTAYQAYSEAGGTLSEPLFNQTLATIENKVDKEAGKTLSSNDYTDAEKEKLANIAVGANKYEHPDNENTRHVSDTEKALWNSKAAGDHNHDTIYQAKGDYALSSHNHSGVYQPAGSYATASHNHDEAYQAKGNYQPAGSYATADHNHDTTYQAKGDYALSSHNHSGVYQPAGSYAAASHNHDEAYQTKGNYQPAGSYATADHNHDTTYQAKGDYALSSHNHSGVYQPAGSYAAAAHNHDTAYQKVESGKGLSSNDYTTADKTRLGNAIVPTDVQTVTSLTGIPVNKYNLVRTYTTATAETISFASTPAEGFECIISIKNNTTADITQNIPTGWQSEDETIDLPAGKITEISIRYILGTYIVRT